MTDDFMQIQDFEITADYIRSRTRHQPGVGLILGSGLGPLADEIQDQDVFPYETLPNFPVSTVQGHAGRMVIGRLAGQTVIALQGRFHFYEGHSVQRITMPIRVMQLLKIHTLIVTNAAGGLNPKFKAGDLMLITDHINLAGMAGVNPLRGPNLDRLGPRFPDMVQVYDPALLEAARSAAVRTRVPLQEGVYVFLTGPSFETPAEIRFLRTIGADAVGMSTVPEVVVARHGGTRVLGISGITNQAVDHPTADRNTTHEEVLETGRLIAPRLATLLKAILADLP